MRAFFDTSALVEMDKRRPAAIALMKKLAGANCESLISTVTVSEFLTGANLQTEQPKFVLKAKEFLMQFSWVPLDGEVADITGKLLAKRIQAGTPVEYQDTAIAASFVASHSDMLITKNTKHFDYDFLQGKVFTPEAALRLVQNKKPQSV